MRTVAEGVAARDSLDYLIGSGCHESESYFHNGRVQEAALEHFAGLSSGDLGGEIELG
jgi:EAL domain-containing protein (putative c-di-GMP-specific phosphodiesterase class I)